MNQLDEPASYATAPSANGRSGGVGGTEHRYRDRGPVAAAAGVPRAFNRALGAVRPGTPVPGIEGNHIPAFTDARAPWFRTSGNDHHALHGGNQVIHSRRAVKRAL